MSTPAEVAARAVNATRTYGRGNTAVRALDDVSVSFFREQFTAIMGPSGSGKSTLLHCLSGLDRLTSGTIFIGSTDLRMLPDNELTAFRRDHIGFIFQSYNLVQTLNAADNITLPVAIAERSVNTGEMSGVVAHLDLADRLKHRPHELSGGQQQRVAAARALVAGVEIIFADEPTGNLDKNSGANLLDVMRDAVDRLKQTIVMVTHDPVAAARADRVVFLADGAVAHETSAVSVDAILGVINHLGPTSKAGS